MYPDILTQKFYIYPRCKAWVKKFLLRRAGGVEAVEASLGGGLATLGVNASWDRRTGQGEVVVLSGIKTLRWAIQQKKAGKIKKLIAGPNIVITPFDCDSLILAPEIDRYIVPAQWSIDWWGQMVPELKEKLAVWPAGVTDTGSLVKADGEVLLYIKHAPAFLVSRIREVLLSRNVTFTEIEYGKYTHADYIKRLSGTKFIIYVSPVESQGLALHSAWMAGVPSLVWNKGEITWQGKTWQLERVTAPYLNAKTGLFFSGREDFSQQLDRFLAGYADFDPRTYSLQNFTPAVSAQKLLDIIAH